MKTLIALGLLTVSLQSFAHPCETVFNETALNTSGVLDSHDRKLVHSFRTSAIEECMAAEKIGKSGLRRRLSLIRLLVRLKLMVAHSIAY
uniref:Uncharacterized protein n=1 Tax=Salmonella phage vB_SE130_2P TaxID=3236707 RepID=A0AB39C5F9_9VIRU